MESINLVKRLSLLLFLFAFIPLAIAENTVYTINQDVLISHPIRVNGALTSTALANITIRNNSAIMINFKAMTYDSATGEYKFLLKGGNVSSLGTYDYCITSTDSGLNDTSCYQFDITTMGDKLSVSQGMIYIVLMFFSLIVFFITLYGALAIPWKNPRDEDGQILNVSDLKYAKMFCMVFSYVLFTWLMWIGWNLSYGYLSFNVMANFFKVAYRILLAFMYPAIVLSFIIMIMRIYNDSKISELIDRGISEIR